MLLATFDNEGNIKDKIKFPTNSDYKGFLIDLAKTAESLTTSEFKAVGIAAPGLIDHKEGLFVKGGNLNWTNEPIQSDIEKILQCPSLLENDAKAASLSEARAWPKKYATVVYITISTGVGIGVCRGGKLDETLLNAEVGGLKVQSNDNFVSWESIASGKALVAKYGVPAAELEGEAAWDSVAYNISLGLISIISIVQPDLIAFGGAVGAHFHKFEKPLIKHLSHLENPLAPTPKIVMAKRPNDAVIYGCYELAKDKFSNTKQSA